MRDILRQKVLKFLTEEGMISNWKDNTVRLNWWAIFSVPHRIEKKRKNWLFLKIHLKSVSVKWKVVLEVLPDARPLQLWPISPRNKVYEEDYFKKNHPALF